MVELLFLLLPIAAGYGWYMGHRSAKKDQEHLSNKLSRDYVTGVNFLLSNQQEKAVDLFLDILQKQESGNSIDSFSQFEAELTLGNLFRSRGEIDRALRIHQSLDNNPHYTFEQRLLAKQQLARDYLTVGFLDRAEALYMTLIEEPEYAELALKELSKIYQRTKEWEKAIQVATQYKKLTKLSEYLPLSHYYCEYFLTLKNNSHIKVNSRIEYLQQAMVIAPKSVRALILLAEELANQAKYQAAITLLEQVADRNILFISEVLPILKDYYQHLPNQQDYEYFLIKIGQQQVNSAIELALIDHIEQKFDINTARNHLYQRLQKCSTMPMLYRFMQYQIAETEEGKGKERLKFIQQLIDEKLKQNFHYQCTNCGFKSHKLLWQCPSCLEWERVLPRHINDY
ncbi:lipopolysaccharide assembly protein LapB [Mergibacter septicus]|uniref:Lipopolysaccharide assembly protein B n=1 Tax=Mergibacter septicus TaxID=221402 RepID=A0A8D4IXG0_9PAST|nr:lipopolysaccharide assembly protein LapB [Mergibacter septicus]AWX15733.1 lipopolysaccharide assembly protein LapB [Mergibacter septicus]QDJ14986.1 lipopolysaccharide assembly protein LapB [Mergibacter septicus]UTU47589.1 lipopolysaccharide assembly protein LapB [Mergibacter septicus]WMR95230.1 lipopolysaccharide assembly protein LapB [Mergibacter septicus]